MLEKLKEAVANGLTIVPLGRVMGFRVTSVELGKAVVEMETNREHANPMGTLHGGVICAIADTAMGIAHSSTLAEGETGTTLELKINFLRPVWSDRLRAIGQIVKLGRTVSVLECDVLDSRDRLVSRSSSTYITLRGDQAAGREIMNPQREAGSPDQA